MKALAKRLSLLVPARTMARSTQAESGGPAPIVRQAVPEDGFGLSELLGTLGSPCPPEEASQRVIDLRADHDQSLFVADQGGALVDMVEPMNRRMA